MLFLLPHWPASLRRSAVIVALLWKGPGGLWWGTILTITLGEASRGTPINDIATSLAVGIALSGVLTMLIGFSGLGHRLARLFTPSVMVLFMLMLGAQLTTIFFKGMLGLPFGIADPNFKFSYRRSRSRWR